jgi:TPR repeat protein
MYMTDDPASVTSAAGVEKDLLLAEKWLRQATAAGSTDAATFLGQLMVCCACSVVRSML